MVPTNSPVSRAYSSYISLDNKYNYLYLLTESTLYFPYEYIYINNLINYSEIQPKYLTGDFTPYGENEQGKYRHLNKVFQVVLKQSDSRTLDSEWCI